MKLNITKLILALIVLVNIDSALAKDIIFKNSEDRINAIKNGRVWLAPAWIDSNFQFSESLDVYNGPMPVNPLEQLLMKDEVSCITTQKDQEGGFGGRTSKLYCRLADASNPNQPVIMTDANGDDLKIKAKYSAGKMNNEIYGEVLGTRILWALGFAADRIYFVNKVNCYGCSKDPYKTRKVDPSTMNNPVSFSPTSIEIRFEGSKMYSETVNERAQQGEEAKTLAEGFSFKELMRYLPDAPAQKYEQYVQRDAMRLLAAFIHHIDLKNENQRIICPTEPDANGACPVQPVLMIQDAGSVFGVKVAGFHLDRVNFKTWSSLPVWKNGAACQTNLSRPFLKDSSMKDVVISEAGRKFLAQLLVGFSAGEAGKKRVEDLFRASRLDTRGRQEDSIAAWRDVFLDKVKQIQYPTGEQNPNFVCPESKN